MAVLVATLGGGAAAHELERTFVTLTFERSGAFVLDIAHDPEWLLLRLERFVADGEPAEPLPTESTARARVRDTRLSRLGDVFIDRVVLFVDGHEVRPASAEYVPPSAELSDEGTSLARFRLRGDMPSSARVLRWYYGLVVDPYPLTLRRADGQATTEWVQGDAWSSTLDLSGQFDRPGRWRAVWQYLALGFAHILPRGLDHILFVLGLFLASRRASELLMQVTTFTVAHSMTLALAVLDVVVLPAAVVEPVIALSIAYVALENVWATRLRPSRLVVVFAFGLMHGMGFAAVLKGLELPRGDLLGALLAFNVGVEGGQMTVVALAASCVWWWRREPWYRARVVVPASLAIACTGLYWTAARLLS